MTTWNDDFMGPAGLVFRTPVKPKRRRSPGSGGGKKRKPPEREMLARVIRTVRRVPQVMVKVSGKAGGLRHVAEHLAYITRNGKLVGERGDGEELRGAAAVRDLARQWTEAGHDRRNARDTINLVLSMPKGSDRTVVAEAARAFARSQFGQTNDYLMAVHDDTDQPHAHITVKARGFDGVMLDPKKDDLQAWREAFAEELRARGMECEATPRASRGQVLKGEAQAVRHMRDRGAELRVDAERMRKALEVVNRGLGRLERLEPWEAAVKRRNAEVRRAWLQIAKVLEGQGGPDFVGLADEIKRFAAEMPDAKTRNELLAERVRGVIELSRANEATRGD